MNLQLAENLVRVIILDISGLYAQIYDERFVTSNEYEDLKKKYSDTSLWRVISLN